MFKKKILNWNIEIPRFATKVIWWQFGDRTEENSRKPSIRDSDVDDWILMLVLDANVNKIVDVGDPNGPNRHQHLIVQHISSPASVTNIYVTALLGLMKFQWISTNSASKMSSSAKGVRFKDILYALHFQLISRYICLRWINLKNDIGKYGVMFKDMILAR